MMKRFSAITQSTLTELELVTFFTKSS